MLVSVLAVLFTLGFAGASFSQELDENLHAFPFVKYEVVKTVKDDVNSTWQEIAAVPSELDIEDTYGYQFSRDAYEASVQVSDNMDPASQDKNNAGEKEAPRLLCADALGVQVEEHAADYCKSLMKS